MDLRTGLKEQYHAGLAMLAECVEKCPDDLWISGQHPRTYWRIVFHNAFFTQLYLCQTEADFEAWPGCHEKDVSLFSDPGDLEPYEMKPDARIYTKPEMLDYIGFVDTRIDRLIDSLDLDTESSGFPWYPDTSKMSHVLMNLRHIQGHVGQLSELLMARGIDTDWIGRR